MAKGFAPKQDTQLGYVLKLAPDLNAYAAKFDLDHRRGDKFIGITNLLEDAQVWKTPKQAQRAINLYMDFLIDLAEQGAEVRISIKRLKQDHRGQLTEEHVQTLSTGQKA